MDSIEFATLNSLAAAYELWGDSGIRVSDSDSEREKSWRRYFERNRDMFLAAYAPGRLLVGVAVVFTDGRKGSIYRLAVKTAWQRKGIGSQLISLAERRIRDSGISGAYVLIENKSVHSRGLFAAKGYTEIDTARYYTRDLTDE